MLTPDFIRLSFSRIKVKTVDMSKLKLDEFIGDCEFREKNNHL